MVRLYTRYWIISSVASAPARIQAVHFRSLDLRSTSNFPADWPVKCPTSSQVDLRRQEETRLFTSCRRWVLTPSRYIRSLLSLAEVVGISTLQGGRRGVRSSVYYRQTTWLESYGAEFRGSCGPRCIHLNRATETMEFFRWRVTWDGKYQCAESIWDVWGGFMGKLKGLLYGVENRRLEKLYIHILTVALYMYSMIIIFICVTY